MCDMLNDTKQNLTVIRLTPQWVTAGAAPSATAVVTASLRDGGQHKPAAWCVCVPTPGRHMPSML